MVPRFSSGSRNGQATTGTGAPHPNGPMDIDLTSLSKREVYKLMIQAIVPRPVAWVLSDNGDGSYNLAPFSYFTGISSDPPLVMVSVGRKPDGSRKDTWVNVRERGDFVVHIASRALAEAVTATSATLPHGTSEVTYAGLETVPFDGCRLPRLRGPYVAMACHRHQVVEVGRGPQGLLFGEIHRLWLDDRVARRVDGQVRIDALALDPLARLGGDDYGYLGGTVTVPRPK